MDGAVDYYKGYIELPATTDLVALVKKAYELSDPKGMGHFHFQEGGLSTEDALMYLRENRHTAAHADYIKGRAVKLTVLKNEGRLLMPPRWFDHSSDQYRELLASVGVTLPEGGA